MFSYESLEKKFSEFVGVKDTVTTNTGTAALHLAIAGKHYPEGSEVIVPEFSMIATALAPHYARCVPVPVDCQKDMNINPLLIEEKITDKTVAIMVTHVYGRICDMEPILGVCRKHDLDLFEDCCEVHGALYHDGPKKGEKVGSLGIGCFSFFRNKIIQGQEGGAVCVADNPPYASHLRDLKNMSFGEEHNYIHEHIGFNYRMPDAQATMILKSLKKARLNFSLRNRVAAIYDDSLLEDFVRPPRTAAWVYDINHCEPKELVKYLNGLGVPARRTFAPMSMQPCFGVKDNYNTLLSYELYSNTCYLPVTPSMTSQEVKHICKLVNEF